MKAQTNLVVAQLNFLVGDIEGNAEKILTAANQAKNQHQADCLLCPELALTGYPPEDLLLRDDFHQRVTIAMQQLRQAVNDIGIAVIVGLPQKTENGIYNAACYLQPGEKPVYYHKRCLPNYGVFDEKRYFTNGDSACVINCAGIKIGLLICEDLWALTPAADVAALGADCIVVLNASPFNMHKATQRLTLLSERAREYHCPFIYVHCVGGQDELVFDGGSIAVNADGIAAVTGDYFKTQLIPIKLNTQDAVSITPHATAAANIDPIAQAYGALVLGCRDYIHKSGFEKVIIGLSGGVDSALTAAVAVDALGPDNVLGCFLPSRFTSPLSQTCNQALVSALAITCHHIAIENCFAAFSTTLEPYLGETNENITEQNIQARIRGVMLMAFANQENRLLLTTGNKSELAVGYATLYGDMAGAFAVLKDAPKTLVYQLCEYRNQISPVIPEMIIHRAPTAELASNQADTDSLPPYDILDQILAFYIEQDLSEADIIARGFNPETVAKIVKLVKRSEYKRRQAPPGVRITSRAFGRERRYPIVSGF